jgi:exopolysaccharide production protein ExoZ
MKLNSIQFLRAIASLLVVYNHSIILQMMYSVSWQQNFYHLKTIGCIGVDLFFVISGFIITYVADKYVGLTQGVNFLLKRFWRINPIYYIACVLCLTVYFLQLWANKLPISSSLYKTISSLTDSILIFPTADNINMYSPLLTVGWTLAFEWLFYLLFFLTILCRVKYKALLLSGIISLLITSGLLLKPTDLRFVFLTNPILLEFILGVIICQLYLKCKKIPVYVGVACLVVGFTSYLLLIIFGFGNVSYHMLVITAKVSLMRFIIWGIPSSFIVAGCIFLDKHGWLSSLFNNKWAQLAGDASYSIYLLNLTFFNLLTVVYKKTVFFVSADAMIWLQMLFAVGIAIGFYKIVERPLIKNMPDYWNIHTITKRYRKRSIQEENVSPPIKHDTAAQLP